MEVKVLEKGDERVKVHVKGVSTALMNALRRIAMGHLPVLAVEDVYIHENTSVMFDELLAHRLAMVPIRTDVKALRKKDSVKLVLEKEGPAVVYSKDIKSSDPLIEVVNKRIPLLKLGKGQRIKIEMDAVMGTGNEHAKWHPGVITFFQVASIETGKDCNLCKKCVEACPKHALEVKGRKVFLSSPAECILCRECVESCKQKALGLKLEEDAFILTIESFGGISPREILEGSVSVLLEKSNELKKAVNKI